MKIVDALIDLNELKEMAKRSFGNMVKAVVYIEKEIMAIDAELHAHEESLLMEALIKNNWNLVHAANWAGTLPSTFRKALNRHKDLEKRYQKRSPGRGRPKKIR